VVEDGVVEFDDLAVDFDGVGDVDGVVHEAGDAFGDAGFAVAGVTEEEDGLGGVDGGSDLVEEVFGEDEVLEGLADGASGDDESSDGLGEDGFDVVVVGDGSGSDVGGFFEGEGEGFVAFGGFEGVDEAGIAGVAVLGDDVDEGLFAHVLQEGVEDAEGEGEGAGEFTGGELAAGEEGAEDEVVEEGEVEAEVFPAGGDGGDVGGRGGGRRGAVVVGGRVAEEGDFVGEGAELFGFGAQGQVMLPVEAQVGDGFGVVFGFGLLQAVVDGGGDHVFDAVDVEVVEVFAGADVAIRGVIGDLPHLLVEFVGDDEAHAQGLRRVTPPQAGDRNNGATVGNQAGGRAGMGGGPAAAFGRYRNYR
jgi:hypothetical protein